VDQRNEVLTSRNRLFLGTRRLSNISLSVQSIRIKIL